MLINSNIKEFLSETASNAPVPGGGSVSALCGALSVSLTEMVANLTVGKKKYESFEEEMNLIIQKSSEYREKLLRDVDDDSKAYNKVINAFKLPKKSEEELKIRKEELERSFKLSATVPFGVAKDCLEIISLGESVIKNGNKNALTDGIVAVMLARTAALGALFNVKINLPSIKDKEFVDEMRKEVDKIEEEIIRKEKEILLNISL